MLWDFSHQRSWGNRFFQWRREVETILHLLKVEMLLAIYQNPNNTYTSQILSKWYKDGVKSMKFLDDKILLDCIRDQILKLYCGYKYTRPCMINRIWGLKTTMTTGDGHAWFHLDGIHWAVRNRLRWKILNENICLQRDSNQRPPLPPVRTPGGLSREYVLRRKRRRKGRRYIAIKNNPKQ